MRYHMTRPFATAATLPEMLKKCGYVTVHCGKAHFGTQGTPGSNPLNMGFDYNIAGTEIGHPADYRGSRHYGKGFNHVRGLDENNYYQDDVFLTEALAREAIKRLEAIRTNPREAGKPFYLYMALTLCILRWMSALTTRGLRMPTKTRRTATSGPGRRSIIPG